MPENYLNNFYDVKTLSLPNELKLVGKHATQDIRLLKKLSMTARKKNGTR